MKIQIFWDITERHLVHSVKPGYNDFGLCDTSSIASDILWYQLIPNCLCDMMLIYLLTAVGVPPGGSSTVHINTQYTKQHNETEYTERNVTIRIHNNENT